MIALWLMDYNRRMYCLCLKLLKWHVICLSGDIASGYLSRYLIAVIVDSIELCKSKFFVNIIIHLFIIFCLSIYTNTQLFLNMQHSKTKYHVIFTLTTVSPSFGLALSSGFQYQGNEQITAAEVLIGVFRLSQRPSLRFSKHVYFLP